VLGGVRSALDVPRLSQPPRTVLAGWNTIVYVYVSSEEAARHALDGFLPARSPDLAVQRRGNVVAIFPVADQTFERRVAAALDRLH
jgi:hypothetical protein